MNIIKIHYKLSKPVTKWHEIGDEAEEMIDFIDSINAQTTRLQGWYNQAHAIAHCQVSETPYSFFVVSLAVEKDKMFPARIIVNPQILEARAEIDGKDNIREYEEPCLSFPFRRPLKVKRFDKIKVRYSYPAIFGTRTVETELSGIASEIFQHEYDHTMARNIYFEPDRAVAWWDLIGRDNSII